MWAAIQKTAYIASGVVFGVYALMILWTLLSFRKTRLDPTVKNIAAAAHGVGDSAWILSVLSGTIHLAELVLLPAALTVTVALLRRRK